jgi:septin family protein
MPFCRAALSFDVVLLRNTAVLWHMELCREVQSPVCRLDKIDDDVLAVSVNNSDSWKTIVNYIDKRFENCLDG